MKDPDVVKRFETIGAEPVGSTPEEMAQHLARESERWTKLIQEAASSSTDSPYPLLACRTTRAPRGVLRCACVPVHQPQPSISFSVLSPIMKKRTPCPPGPVAGRHPRAALGPRPSPRFPSKPVSIVVPYAPGGPVDNLSRVLATRLGKEWASPCWSTKPAPMKSSVRNSWPEPRRRLHAVRRHRGRAHHEPAPVQEAAVQPREGLHPISRLISVPMVFFVPAASKANTLKEFIELAKR
jgi:hypothetical protein